MKKKNTCRICKKRWQGGKVCFDCISSFTLKYGSEKKVLQKIKEHIQAQEAMENETED